MSTSRPYRSAHRARQAEDTRLVIRRAARSLFGSGGFAGTTVTAIARDAGVSPATVYATYGSKAAIVAAIIDELEAESDMAGRGRAMLEQHDPESQVRLFVSAHVELLAGGVDVLRAALDARGEPEVRTLLAQGDSRRRDGLGRIVDSWVARGVLPERARIEATDRAWLLTTVESFVHAVDGLGWDAARVEHWLTELLVRQVLDPLRGTA